MSVAPRPLSPSLAHCGRRRRLCSSLEMRYWPKRRRRHIIGRQKCSRQRDRQLEAASEREGEGELLLDLYFLPLLLPSHPLPRHAFCLATRVHLPSLPSSSLLFSCFLGIDVVRAKEEGKNEQEAKVKHGSSSSVRIEVTLYFSFVSEEEEGA